MCRACRQKECRQAPACLALVKVEEDEAIRLARKRVSQLRQARVLKRNAMLTPRPKPMREAKTPKKKSNTTTKTGKRAVIITHKRAVMARSCECVACHRICRVAAARVARVEPWRV